MVCHRRGDRERLAQFRRNVLSEFPGTAGVSPACGRDGRGPEGALTDIELNGRQYRLPSQPTVVICADGCDPAYLEAGLAARVLPTIAQWRKAGYFALAE